MAPAVPERGGGLGAAVGRFGGTISRLAIGGIVVVILAIAAFF